MAKNTFQLNYDEMTAIAKKFKDEGEDITRLHANTRQRVRDLYKEWVGEGAEKFFEEMETKLLPAVQRLAHALFLSQDATNDIMKIIQGADEETVGFFRNQLGGDDFGAGKFNEALQGLQSGPPGADDFGAGKFGDALNNPTTDNESASPSVTDGQTSDSTSSQEHGESSDKNQKKTEETKPEPTSGGGGGGSSSSQGFKGDLKNMGAGLVDQVPQDASSGGGLGSPVNMPDHVYSGGDLPKPDGAPSGIETASNNDQSASESGGSGVAGVAGAAGAAAAGGGAKAIKKRKKKNG